MQTAGGEENNYGLMVGTTNNFKTPHIGVINNFHDNEMEISFESSRVSHTSCTLYNTSFGTQSVANVLMAPENNEEVYIDRIQVVLFLG